MLTIRHIQKSYHHSLILHDIFFEIPRNTIAGIIGPNGAGKSTILKIVTGFENPDRGDVYFQDRKISSFDEKMSLFSYMPEHLMLYPDYYVHDFINFIQNTTAYKNPELIDRLNLASVKHKKIQHLSKGYKQRLKLFFALSNHKPIVVLDEPFDGFDPIQVSDILELIISENKKGRTFLVSIHQLYDAEKLCQYYILLNGGNVVAQGTIDTLRQKFGQINTTLEHIFIRALR